MEFKELIADFANRHGIENLTAEDDPAVLESFVNLAETWRQLLADFRPVAKAAAEQEVETSLFGAQGFVQV